MTRDNSIVVEKLVRQFKKGLAPSTGSTSTSRPGEIYGFLGPNGAGKSTTVLMLTTLLPPTDGTALVGGYDVRTEGPKVRSVIGAALQEAALDPLLTGRDHLRLQTMLQAIPRAERKARQDELLDRVGLTEAADRKVGGYSGGMKRRLDLALALVHRPQHPLPRRADDRARPAEPHRALGGGRAARPRGRRHRLPDDAVPRGGRRARRPGRDHRPRQDRRRGHSGGAQGRDRPAQHPRDPAPRTRPSADPGAARRGSARSSAASATSRCGSATASGWPTCPRDGRERHRRRRRRAPRADARRRVPRQDRAVARGRRRRGRARRRRAAAMSAPADAGRCCRAAVGDADRCASRRARSRRCSSRSP